MSRRVTLLLALLALLTVAVRLAWVGDDAYITLRSVEHLALGEGARWNTIDRVQTFTHPLWFLLLAAGRMLTGEVYLATLGLSLLLSALAIGLLLRTAGSAVAIATTAVLLLATRTFVDYTTSGLETPATYLLLVLFVGAVVRPAAEHAQRRVLWIALLAALLATNRLDLALLAAPAVLAALPSVGIGRGLWLAAVGALPFFGWLLFAIVYYGSPLPVTAHAKAFGVGIPAADMVQQGLRYAEFAWREDPVLLGAIGLGVLVGLMARPTRWLALGALLQCGYVIKVGGDFMAGRFFLPPFVVAVAILAPWLGRRSAAVAAVASLAALVGLFVPGVPWWLRSPASEVQPTQAEIDAQHGIVDERRMHYRALGLLAPERQAPVCGAMQDLVFPQGRTDRWFLLNGSVGTAGFQMGPRGHLVDPLLCDPLIARLPAKDPHRWRIGHILRRIPEGYWETLRSGRNELHHPGLRAYYGALQAATRAELFAGERWRALWQLAVGTHDDGLRAFVASDYRSPPRLPVALAELPPPLPAGVFWFDEPRIRLCYEGGLGIALGGERTASSVRLQVLGVHYRYQVIFRRGGQAVGRMAGTPLPSGAVSPLQAVSGLHDEQFVLPPSVGAFDELWIDAIETVGSDKATGPCGIGALVLEPM